MSPTAAAPTVFNSTIRMLTPGYVRRCTFVNSYHAIAIECGRTGVTDCLIGGIYRGITIDNALDWVLISNVQNQVLWDTYPNLQFPQTLDAWVLANSIALAVFRCDSLIVNNFSVFARFVGIACYNSSPISFTGTTTSGSQVISAVSSTVGLSYGAYITGAGIPAGAIITQVGPGSQITISSNATSSNVGTNLSAAGAGYGRLSNIDLDFVSYGIFAFSSNTSGGGYKITNMDIGGNGSGVGTPAQTTVYLAAGGINPASILWIGGSVRGNWASGSPRPTIADGQAIVYDVIGINNVGPVPTPVTPLSGVGLKNPYSIPVRIGIAASGFPVSSVEISTDGTSYYGTGLSGSNLFYMLEPNEWIKLTYAGTVNWAWFAA